MPTNAEIVGLALDRITAGYVFPQRAVEMNGAIRSRLAAGAYNTLSGPALCAAVTAHLQEVCPDKHLRLLWQDEPQSTDPADEDEGRAAFLAMLRAENQGVRRFEHLEGNIGHLDIRWIADAGEGARAIGAAMELAAHTSALILDLRECRGGSPEGAAMWCSYFFPDDQVHLNDIYERSTGSPANTGPPRICPRHATSSARCMYSPVPSPSRAGRTWRTPCRRTDELFSSAKRPAVVLTRPPGTR